MPNNDQQNYADHEMMTSKNNQSWNYPKLSVKTAALMLISDELQLEKLYLQIFTTLTFDVYFSNTELLSQPIQFWYFEFLSAILINKFLQFFTTTTEEGKGPHHDHRRRQANLSSIPRFNFAFSLLCDHTLTTSDMSWVVGKLEFDAEDAACSKKLNKKF